MADDRQDRRLLERALRELESTRRGQPSGPAMRAFCEAIRAVVHATVARTLLRHGHGRTLANLRAEVEDHVQIVYGRLFEHQARALRVWDPGRGKSLRGWVARLAAMRTRDALRNQARNPWNMEAVPLEWFDALVPDRTHEDDVATAQLLRSARDRVLRQQSDQGKKLFELLFEQDGSTQEIIELTGLSDAAVYQWRRRLRAGLQAELIALMSEPHTSARNRIP